MKHYPERRWLRASERLVTSLEAVLGRLIPSAINPFYHLGTLAVFLLIVLLLTGLYLTLLYRPNANVAYASVDLISASWIGGPIRSIHRYASSALMVVLLLHALKMFLSERFWGTRWLSWVSGWLMLLIIAATGAMGYWLVWDQRAQWLTDYSAGLLGGAVQVTFATPSGLTGAVTFFIIILFLHIFLSIIILGGLALHVLRLARVRLWAPRLLMAELTLALLIVALVRPATSAPPADPSRLVSNMTLDGWYLGFLPLAASWGSTVVWGGSLLIAAVLLAIPWVARGRHLGPAEVIRVHCTGCTLCAHECPYGAIEMLTRSEGGRFETIATITPSQCTGCGICVGTCATVGVELASMPSESIRRQIAATLDQRDNTAPAPVALFICQRHAGLNTLERGQPANPIAVAAARPALPGPGDVIALVDERQPVRQPVTITEAFQPWHTTIEGFGHDAHPAICFPVPCVGMVQPEWARDALHHGAQTAIVVGCPPEDCAFREGPHWVNSRLGRRRGLTEHGVQILHTVPGDQRGLKQQLAALTLGAPVQDQAKRPLARFAPVLVLVVVLVFTLLGLALDRPTSLATQQASLRLVMTHAGRLRNASAAEGQPIDITSAQALSGERLPVRLKLDVDGQIVLDREYAPGGLRRDGAAFVIENLALAPGNHILKLDMMEDASTWQTVYAGPIQVEAGRVGILVYDTGTQQFVAEQ